MHPAIFLDRDGVINRERNDWTFRLEDVEILDGVYNTLAELQKRGYLFIIITNQSGIDLGLFTVEDMNRVHNYITGELKKRGISIAEIYYCPHHPTVGKCICRKPDSVMIEKAAARFNIDISKSYMVGDRDRDIEAGEKIGLTCIKVDSNSALDPILTLIE